MKKAPRPRSHGASSKGFHFLEEFKRCKKKFFIKEVLGIESDRKPFQLSFGSAFHAGKQVFYETASTKKAIAAYQGELETLKSEIEGQSKIIEELRKRGPIMLERWIDLLGRNDLAVYDVLALEDTFEVRLPNGYLFTFKPDLVVKPKGDSKTVYLFDTKTSWYSAHFQAEEVETSDQATSYIYGWNRLHPDLPAYGMVADCISWSLATEDPQKIQVSRGNIVQRTPLELWEWEQGAMSDLLDMASRVRALETSSYASTFPRSTSECLSYNRRCPFYFICRSDLTEMKSLPGGFHKGKSGELKKLVRMKDSIPLVSRPKGKVRK